ncbi:MAG: ATP synthase F1 subunit delta [Acidobacteriota bacterium]
MSRRVARPYAAALFQVMERKGVGALREVEAQLATTADVFHRYPALLRTFEVPGVGAGRKQKLLAEIGRALQLRVEAQRLLAALAQHYRLRFLPDVVAALRALVDRREGMVRGSVELPVAATPQQVSALAKVLEERLGSRVELESRSRPELLAGFVVRVGSQVFDGSLRAQLARFARSGKER